MLAEAIQPWNLELPFNKAPKLLPKPGPSSRGGSDGEMPGSLQTPACPQLGGDAYPYREGEQAACILNGHDSPSQQSTV